MAVKPLKKFRFNSSIKAELKDFLPIIGNVIPNKKIMDFATLTDWTYQSSAGTGNVDNGLDYEFAYNAEAVRKLHVPPKSGGPPNIVQITHTFSTPADFKNLLSTQNNYATIKRTGDGGNDEDKLFIVLNVGYVISDANAGYQIQISVASAGGKTATMKSATWSLANHTRYFRDTFQVKRSSADFNYAGGFADSDWEAIDSITIAVLSTSASAGAIDIVFHNLNLALPKQSATVTDGYYKIPYGLAGCYVSKLYGNDDFEVGSVDRSSREYPFKTIQGAINFTNNNGGGIQNIVILDSEIYKPVSIDYSDIGIKQTLDTGGNPTTLMSDYLETPKLSVKEGVSDNTKVGARKRRHSVYTVIQEGLSANIWYVSKAGNDGTKSKGDITHPALTIGSAYTAASAGDCIRIIDDGIYTEDLSIGKNITLEASAGHIPTIRGNISQTDGTSFIDGFILKGTGGTSEIAFNIGNAALPISTLSNCTITGWGASTGDSKGIQNFGARVSVENCLFIDNGENFSAIFKQANTAFDTIAINNLAYMGATRANAFFVFGRSNGDDNALSVVLQNTVLGSSDVSQSLFISCLIDGAGTAGTNKFYCYLNDSNMPSLISTWGSAAGNNNVDAYIMYNYFHDCYVDFIGNVNGNVVDSFILVWIPIGGSGGAFPTVKLTRNRFTNITQAVANDSTYRRAAVGVSFVARDRYVLVKENVFESCSRGIFVASSYNAGGGNYDYNTFLGCDIAFECEGIAGSVGGEEKLLKTIMSNCAIGIKHYVNHTDGIKYNSPNGSFGHEITNAGVNTEDPKIEKIVRNTLAVEFDGAFERLYGTLKSYILSKRFIECADTIQETLTLMFLEIEGSYGCTGIDSANNLKTYVKYCYIHDFMFGIKASHFVDCQNLTLEYNGVGHRAEMTTTEALNFKHIIMKNNYIGHEVKSYVYAEHVTGTANTYGVVDMLSGYLAKNEYANTFATMKDNIYFDNLSYDYYCRLRSTNCIIGTRFYDTLPTTDIRYIVTESDTDFNYLFELDALYLYPAIKPLGYLTNSPAYKNASDSLNIGARSRIALAATLDYVEGVVQDNPVEVPLDLKPINQSSTYSVEGVYDSQQDAFVRVQTLSWSDDSYADEDQKELLENIFMTEWIVLMSDDNGGTWGYFLSSKDGNFSMKQFMYFDDSLPYVGEELILIQIPDFNIDDYLVDEIGG